MARLAATPVRVLVSVETENGFQLTKGDTINPRLMRAADHRYHAVPFTRLAPITAASAAGVVLALPLTQPRMCKGEVDVLRDLQGLTPAPHSRWRGHSSFLLTTES